MWQLSLCLLYFFFFFCEGGAACSPYWPLAPDNSSSRSPTLPLESLNCWPCRNGPLGWPSWTKSSRLVDGTQKSISRNSVTALFHGMSHLSANRFPGSSSVLEVYESHPLHPASPTHPHVHTHTLLSCLSLKQSCHIITAVFIFKINKIKLLQK